MKDKYTEALEEMTEKDRILYAETANLVQTIDELMSMHKMSKVIELINSEELFDNKIKCAIEDAKDANEHSIIIQLITKYEAYKTSLLLEICDHYRITKIDYYPNALEREFYDTLNKRIDEVTKKLNVSCEKHIDYYKGEYIVTF